MLKDINLDAIPSGETRAAILILAGRLQALEDQVKALVTGNTSATLSGAVSSEKPAPAPKSTPKRTARKVSN